MLKGLHINMNLHILVSTGLFTIVKAILSQGLLINLSYIHIGRDKNLHLYSYLVR